MQLTLYLTRFCKTLKIRMQFASYVVEMHNSAGLTVSQIVLHLKEISTVYIFLKIKHKP
jgi:hypothetical protein